MVERNDGGGQESSERTCVPVRVCGRRWRGRAGATTGGTSRRRRRRRPSRGACGRRRGPAPHCGTDGRRPARAERAPWSAPGGFAASEGSRVCGFAGLRVCGFAGSPVVSVSVGGGGGARLPGGGASRAMARRRATVDRFARSAPSGPSRRRRRRLLLLRRLRRVVAAAGAVAARVLPRQKITNKNVRSAHILPWFFVCFFFLGGWITRVTPTSVVSSIGSIAGADITDSATELDSGPSGPQFHGSGGN